MLGYQDHSTAHVCESVIPEHPEVGEGETLARLEVGLLNENHVYFVVFHKKEEFLPLVED